MTPDARETEPLVDLSAITEIELRLLKRVREVAMGEHRSRVDGSGFDFVGLRDWQPGDPPAAIDWPQSSLTGFNPMIVREFQQPSTASVTVVADASPSTRCGLDGTSVAAAIARTIATIGMSAVFFQDTFGLITFDAGFERLSSVRPRIGKNHVIHCLDAYQDPRDLPSVSTPGSLSEPLAGFLRKTSLVPVVSDFLFTNARTVLEDLSHLNATHDVVIVLIDSAFAFEVPRVSAGWIEMFDVETGAPRLMSRRAVAAMPGRARAWQDEVERMARDADLDTVRLSVDETQSALALLEFVIARRLRKA